MVDAFNASAADFDRVAHRWANSFWLWLVVFGAVWVMTSIWWALIPAAFAVWAGYQSIESTRAATALRKGTYPLPNPNNGRPD